MPAAIFKKEKDTETGKVLYPLVVQSDANRHIFIFKMRIVDIHVLADIYVNLLFIAAKLFVGFLQGKSFLFRYVDLRNFAGMHRD